MSDLFRSIAGNKLPPSFPLPPPRHGRVPQNLEPSPWNLCFDNHSFVDIPRGSFSVYSSQRHDNSVPTVLFLHGASYSALSFALLTRYLSPYLNVVAYDQRCHGLTKAEINFELDCLVADCEAIIEELKLEKVLLVGHSMGAAVASKVAIRDKIELYGIVVIDVCGNTALQSLVFMKDLLETRPKHFDNFTKFVEFCLLSKISKNLDSLKFSAQDWVMNKNGIPASQTDDRTNLTWITPLEQSEDCWAGWFETLSSDFVDAPTHARLLILANQDTMDRDMIIAHMSGQLQLEIIHNVGHSIHEDNPKKIAEILLGFTIHHRYIDSSLVARDRFNNILLDDSLQ